LIDQLPQGQLLIADNGYDSDHLRQQIEQKGMTPMIPGKANSRTGNGLMDRALYKYRHSVENAFARLKHFRAIATRYDKLKRNYQAMVAFACCFMWLPVSNVNRPWCLLIKSGIDPAIRPVQAVSPIVC
jgi:transposase